MNKTVFPIHSRQDSPTPFVVRRDEDFRIVHLGYINKEDPSGDAIFDPLDLTRVEITKKGELPDGTKVFLAKNNCDCGVHIEVFKKG